MKKNYVYFLSVAFVAIISFVVFTIFEDEFSFNIVEKQSYIPIEAVDTNLQKALNKEDIANYLNDYYTNIKLYDTAITKDGIACDVTQDEIYDRTSNALSISNSIYDFKVSNNVATFKYVISIVNISENIESQNLINSTYEYYIKISVVNSEYVINKCELRRANSSI